jgi:hypothetical protein
MGSRRPLHVWSHDANFAKFGGDFGEGSDAGAVDAVVVRDEDTHSLANENSR